MPKILVADDNSNVQKTVATALADLGVEVIAVNNGDAAIRRLPEVSPDLVLADIFMPVRNGYEVCDYVKKDSRFANVPVVLLVGAFDPLDEREAQRAGADGILKKPFVPPDPLITMVKTLLDRSLGERLVSVSAAKPAASAQGKASPASPAAEYVPAPEPSDELTKEELPAPPARVSFGEGERPIAFGQLLESPARGPSPTQTGALEPVDDEQVLTSSRDAALGEPIFWQNESPEPEAEDEEAQEDVSAGGGTQGWTPEVGALPRRGDPVPLEPMEAEESLEIVRDEPDAQTPTIVEPTGSILQDPASQAPLTVHPGKPEDLAASPLEWMATVPPPHLAENSVPAAKPVEPSMNATHVTEEVEIEEIELEEMESLNTSPTPAAAPPAASVAPPAAAPLALPLPPAPPAPPEPKVAAAPPAPTKTQSAPRLIPQSAEDAVRSMVQEEWADLAASLKFKPAEADKEKAKPAPTAVVQAPAGTSGSAQPAAPVPTPPVVPPSAPDSALVEAVVQRVLDKMRPQVVDLITKELLRPVVQALVTREIEKP